jgi:hypothetical protein
MHRDFDMLNRSRVDIRVIPAPHFILNQTAASGVAVLHSEISAN